MKITCSKNDLLKSVNISLRSVPVRTTMTILECILIHATADQIKFTTNDMELGIETIVKGTVEEKGTVAVGAKILSDIIRKLPDNDVTISSDENFMTTITCEKARFEISGKSGEDFPLLPYIDREDGISISQFSLKEIIQQTIFSIAINENNKMMTGELLEIADQNLKLTSLDGHRISIRKLELARQYENRKAVVPGKTLSEISRILSGEMDDPITLYFTSNQVLFEMEETLVVSRLIEGEYFKIDQMLSSDYETKFTINRREFLDCIDRASLLVKEGDKRPIIITVSDDLIDLKIHSAIGSMNEKISIQKEGKDIQIGFNPRFLMDALRAIEDENIDIYLMNPKAPCFIRNEVESYIYLILPVNFSSVDV